MIRKIGQPRFIDESLIEIGDLISVEHRQEKGVTMTIKGIVDKIDAIGRHRYLLTKEGSTILAWEPGRASKVKVTLLGREEPENATIFDLPDNPYSNGTYDELRERMTG